MIRKVIFTILFLINITAVFAQRDILINVYNRPVQSFNGDWNYIVNPYENGYYNYRSLSFDKMENPGKGVFLLNAKQVDK